MHSSTDNRLTAERAIIGAVILDSAKAMSILIRMGCEPEWFKDATHSQAYTYAFDMFKAGKPVNSLLLTAGLKAKGEKPNLQAYLESCVDACATVAHTEHYAEQLRGYRLIEAGLANMERDTTALMQADPLDVLRMVGGIQDSWIELCAMPADTKALHEIGAELIEEWSDADKLKRGHIMWPLARLNSAIGPLEDELVFLVAKESVGKTAFALQMILSVAYTGKIVSMASLESSKRRLLPRMIGQIAQINTLDMRYGHGEAEHFEKATAAVAKIRRLNLRVSDTPATIDQLYAWAKGEKAAGSALIVIDNIRHIRSTQTYRSPVEQMRDFSLRLKHIRDDIRLPVIVLHHTNDAGDVSWAKDIRRDADILLFLAENEELSVRGTESTGYIGKTIVDCQIDKNRDGKAHIEVQAQFFKEFQTFKPFPPEEDESWMDK